MTSLLPKQSNILRQANMGLSRLPSGSAYVFAVAITLATLLARMQLGVFFAQRPLLILFMLPIILSAYIGGFWSGLVSTLLAAASVDYFLIPPTSSLWIAETHDLIQWLILIMCGVLVSVLNESLRRLQRQLAAVITGQSRAEENLRQLNAELEQRVVERTAQLQAANQELEAFSYSVSHDLRAPLRSIDGFSRILLEDYVASLPDEAQRYLNLVRSNAKQMQQLVDDLLAFSRLSRQPLNKHLVSVEQIVNQVLDEFRAEQNNRQVEISIGTLPPCEADPALLKQVYVNLLANAFKFTSKCDPAQIEIGFQELNGERVYFVKDNGVGFDSKYADKLFGVFQRLHRAEDYEGTGVGLAIVQRIIHRHGGQVRAEGEMDKGATFYFTL